MSMISAPPAETVAELLSRLGIPGQRVLLSPPPGQATELDAVRSRRLCELVDGVMVEKPLGWFESRLAAALIYYLETFLERNPLGFVLDGSGLIRVEPGQLRMPDVSVFLWTHFPNRVLPQGQILDKVPDLAVEILSPSNTKEEMARKRLEYFAGGAQLVWEVNPETRTIDVYSAPETWTTLDENGTLDGGAVLPGFTLSVRAWFERAGQRGA